MKIPCIEPLKWIVMGLSFLQPAMTPIQFNNLILVATALILGSRFKLSEISQMWLGEKAVSTFSYFFSEAKFSVLEMQELYAVRVMQAYPMKSGYFIIDDTMEHHTKLCKWIHGVCCLFDHVLKTNLKAKCLVFLYYSDGFLIKFPILPRIFYQESKPPKAWQSSQKMIHKTKNELAIEMIEWALEKGFPPSTVLADSWFCVQPFIKELRRLQLPYILEAKSSYKLKISCKVPKRTPTGKLAKNQYDLYDLGEYFHGISDFIRCGFARDFDTGKREKTLYHAKIVTAYFNAFPGKHRVVQSIDPRKGTIKYLITNQLHWEASKILSNYSNRWVIEEFFRNAKQLTDMEGATIRSQEGVTLSLHLISWIDFLLHQKNYQSAAETPKKEPLSVPSIVRQAQTENMEKFIQKVQSDETFVKRWVNVTQKSLHIKRKQRKELVDLDAYGVVSLPMAA